MNIIHGNSIGNHSFILVNGTGCYIFETNVPFDCFIPTTKRLRKRMPHKVKQTVRSNNYYYGFQGNN
jgi:hypothetical protein